MTRLIMTMRCDVTLQVRNGFYAATVFVTIIWALILMQASALNLTWLLPPMVVGNLLIGTFYFIGGMVLLEKGDGTLSAQVVTPLHIGEYLAAKVVTLSCLALVEALVTVIAVVGWRFNALLLIAGVLLASALYCLAGFIVVSQYAAINEYLLPSGAYVTLLWVPLIAFMAQWWHWLLYLHPMSAPLLLVKAAFEPVPGWQVLYGLVYSAVWIAILYIYSRRAFRQWIIA